MQIKLTVADATKLVHKTDVGEYHFVSNEYQASFFPGELLQTVFTDAKGMHFALLSTGDAFIGEGELKLDEVDTEHQVEAVEFHKQNEY